MYVTIVSAMENKINNVQKSSPSMLPHHSTIKLVEGIHRRDALDHPTHSILVLAWHSTVPVSTIQPPVLSPICKYVCTFLLLLLLVNGSYPFCGGKRGGIFSVRACVRLFRFAQIFKVLSSLFSVSLFPNLSYIFI